MTDPLRILADAIRSLAERVRALETPQEGNGFVPYLARPAASLGTGADVLHGTHPTKRLLAGETAYVEFTMPRRASTLEEAVLVYFPTSTGSWDYTIDTAGGACGEDEAIHTDSQTADGVAVTDDQIACLDITAALTPYVAGDQVGLQITCDVLTTTTEICIIGVRLR